ncbi:MAG: response regulator, partial [Ketobacteraceae bacterium]|nr:response regulator [Ketobacteraceae bacterium]
GYTATQTIRQSGYDSLPIVALTANVMPEDKEKCLQSGMSDYLSKPVKPIFLREMLQRWTAGSTGSSELDR